MGECMWSRKDKCIFEFIAPKSPPLEMMCHPQVMWKYWAEVLHPHSTYTCCRGSLNVAGKPSMGDTERSAPRQNYRIPAEVGNTSRTGIDTYTKALTFHYNYVTKTRPQHTHLKTYNHWYTAPSRQYCLPNYKHSIYFIYGGSHYCYLFFFLIFGVASFCVRYYYLFGGAVNSNNKEIKSVTIDGTLKHIVLLLSFRTTTFGDTWKDSY
jgi:hypothetical protein